MWGLKHGDLMQFACTCPRAIRLSAINNMNILRKKGEMNINGQLYANMQSSVIGNNPANIFPQYLA